MFTQLSHAVKQSSLHEKVLTMDWARFFLTNKQIAKESYFDYSI